MLSHTENHHEFPSLGHVAASTTPEHDLELIGSLPISVSSFVASLLLLQLRFLPSAVVTRFIGTMNLSDIPRDPAHALAGNNSAYDPLNRLVSFVRGTLSSSGNNGSGLDTVTTPSTLAGSTQSFALDAVGNQTSTTTDGTTVAKTQNSQNQLTGVGYATLAYDLNGNTTTDESGNTLTYDAWNRMVTDSAGTTSYTFDANNRRVTETHSGTTTNLYFTTQGQAIEERVAGTVTAQNVWSIDYVNSLLVRDDNTTAGNLGISGSGLGNRVYYQHDANFNVTATVDPTGTVLNNYVYTPYGVQTVLDNTWAIATGVANSIYGFQGGRYDVVTGLNRFGARDYNPKTGTWEEPDPARSRRDANTFQALGSNPTRYLDPTGETPIPIFLTDGVAEDLLRDDAADWAKQGWHLAADMLDHFLDGGGAPYALNATDIQDIKQQGTLTSVLKANIIEKYHVVAGRTYANFPVSGQFSYRFGPLPWESKNLFYGFGAISVTYEGTLCGTGTTNSDGMGAVQFTGTMTFYKRYNFDLDYVNHYLGYAASNSWRAGYLLQADSKAFAFNLVNNPVSWDALILVGGSYWSFLIN